MWWSQRQSVLPLIWATKQDSTTLRVSSGRLQSESGRPNWRGISQARGLTWTTSSEGESPWPTRAWQFFEAAESLKKEALAALADHLAMGVEAGGDLVVGDALGGEEDHPGAEDLKVWQRILGGSSMELALFGR